MEYSKSVLDNMLFKGHFEDDHPLPESSRPHSDTRPQTLKHIKDPDDLPENKIPGRSKYFKKKEKSMNRSYTMDEITTAQLLKGHPQAQAILDELNKGKKKNESGDEFQDGSEDTIGGEGHEANLRGVDHKTGSGGHPGTSTKNASQDDFDLEKSIQIVGDFLMEKGYDIDQTNEIIEDYFGLEKSDNFTDNEPEEFEDGLVGAEGEDDDGDVLVSKKSMTADEETLNHLIKTMGYERIEDVLKATLPQYTKPGALSSKENAPSDKEKASNPLINRKPNPDVIRGLTQKVKSQEDFDLIKSEDNDEDDEDENKDTEKSFGGSEEMEDNGYSLNFSKSILQNMGLEKGSPSVSAKVSGGKATQISYSDKPESRFSHPKSKEDKRYRHEPEKGEVTVRTRPKGDKAAEWKERKLDTSNTEENQKKLKNASEGGFDLYKTLDEILEKKTR